MTFDCNRRGTPGCSNNCLDCPLYNNCKYCKNRNNICDKKKQMCATQPLKEEVAVCNNIEESAVLVELADT